MVSKGTQYFGVNRKARFSKTHMVNLLSLSRQLAKKDVVKNLEDNAPSHLAGESVVRVNTMDGIKFYLADKSWLLIRPSGTEPVLRIYAEARSDEMVAAMLEEGGKLGQTVLG